jgi:ribose transport system substrate-binding protein
MTSAADETTPRTKSRGGLGLTVVLILIILLLAGAFAWQSGLLNKQVRIAIVTSTEDVYWDRLFLGGLAAGRYFDADVQTLRCKADEKTQSQMIRDLVAGGIDGLIVSPTAPESQLSLLNEVAGKVPLVTVDSDSPRANKIAFIGTNNYEAGKQCAELLTDAIPDGGEVILCVGSVENDNGKSRREAIIDALLQRARDSNRALDPLETPIVAGKYTIVTTLIDTGDPEKATSMAIDAIKKHPNLKCMVGIWSYNIPSLLEALKQTGKLGQIRIVGFDDHEATLQGVEAGQVYGTLVQDQFNMGFDSVMLMCATLKRNSAADIGPRKAILTCTAILNAEDVKNFRLEKSPTTAP